MVAVGTSSCANSSRFGATSTFNAVTPVRLPPGRLRLDKTKLNRVHAGLKYNRNGRRRRLCRERCRNANRDDHVDLAADQIGHQRRQPIELALGPLQPLTRCPCSTGRLVGGHQHYRPAGHARIALPEAAQPVASSSHLGSFDAIRVS
jgi:hypothetical protein